MNEIEYTPFIKNSSAEDPIKLDLESESTSNAPVLGYVPQYNLKKDSVTNIPDTPEEEDDFSKRINFILTPKEYLQSSAIKGKGKYILSNDKINVGGMKGFLDVLSDAGISVRVTSGIRKNSKTSNGAKSYHSEGKAIDIVPIEGQTYDDLRNQIQSSPEVINYMKIHRIGILDETDADTMKKTGATGPHWHVGPDNSAIKGLNKMLYTKSPVFTSNAKMEDLMNVDEKDYSKYSDLKTTNDRPYYIENILYAENFFLNHKLDRNLINILLGNIIEESGGDPRSKSSTGKYTGLLQWAKDRYVIDNSKSDKELFDEQLQYILDSISQMSDRKSWTDGGPGSGFATAKQAFDTFWDSKQSIENRQRAFSRCYVRPEGKDLSYMNRLKVVKQIIDRQHNY